MFFERLRRRTVLRAVVFLLLLVLCGLPFLTKATIWRIYLAGADRAYHADRLEEAERLYKLAVTKAEAFGPTDPRLALCLNNLAGLYYDRGKYDRAEALFERALVIDEKALGPDSGVIAEDLNNLAALYRKRGKYDQAELLYKRSLKIS